MNLRDLDYVTAIAEHGSFVKAAAACHVSASTLSIQLAKLEGYLGVRLFERTNKRVEPTAIGHELIAIAQDIVRQSRRLREAAKEGQNPLGGVLKLGLFPTLAPYYLPTIVPRLVKAFPNLKLQLVEEKSPRLLQMLKTHELDAAFLSLPVDDKELASAFLFDDPFYLACPANHPLAKRKIIKIADLAFEALLLLEDGHCLRDQALDVCHMARAKEGDEFRATSLETLRQMVASGAGMTLVPETACLAAEGVRYIPFVKKNAPMRKIGLVWRKSTARVELFRGICGLLGVDR